MFLKLKFEEDELKRKSLKDEELLAKEDVSKKEKGKKEVKKEEKKEVKKDAKKDDKKEVEDVKAKYKKIGTFKETVIKELTYKVGNEVKVVKQMQHEDIPDVLQTYINDKKDFVNGTLYNYNEYKSFLRDDFEKLKNEREEKYKHNTNGFKSMEEYNQKLHEAKLNRANVKVEIENKRLVREAKLKEEEEERKRLEEEELAKAQKGGAKKKK